MLVPGLCSITLRALDVEAVLTRAVAAGLAGVEWGGDVHVPVGDLETARAVAARTRDAGLAVTSYGSYHRAGASDDLPAVVATAAALGAPRIRIWAGASGSAEASPEERTRTTVAVADAVRRAGEAGIEVGCEWHGGTLTDTAASTTRLLAEVDDLVGSRALTTYWQPALDRPDDVAVAELAAVLERVSTVHVFSWWPGTERLPLLDRDPLWHRVVRVLSDSGRDHDLLLEFVPDDDPDLLAPEAAVLRAWLSA